MNDAAERRVQLEHHRQLDASDVQAGEEKGHRCHQPDVEVRQHHHEQREIAVVARNGRNEPVVYGRHLEIPGESGKPASKQHGQDHEPRRLEAVEKSRAGVAADGLQIQADPGVAQHQAGRNECGHDEGESDRWYAEERRGVQPERGGKGLRPAHGGHPGLFPGAEDKPQHDALRHEVEPQPRKDFVDPALCFQETRDRRPQRPAQRGGSQRKDDEHRAHVRAIDTGAQRPSGEHGTYHDLAFHPDVPQADPESE